MPPQAVLDEVEPPFAGYRRTEQVLARPYWNVPPSILRSEIVRSIERDGGYIARKNYEVVTL